nr:hypothetical protein [Tanacetum cinerariifolium]
MEMHNSFRQHYGYRSHMSPPSNPNSDPSNILHVFLLTREIFKMTSLNRYLLKVHPNPLYKNLPMRRLCRQTEMYSSVQDRHESGACENTIYQKAEKEHCAHYKSAFQLSECWKVLKDHKKWRKVENLKPRGWDQPPLLAQHLQLQQMLVFGDTLLSKFTQCANANVFVKEGGLLWVFEDQGARIGNARLEASRGSGIGETQDSTKGSGIGNARKNICTISRRKLRERHHLLQQIA